MKIVDIALSQVGEKESKLNKIKYNDWYYGKSVSGGQYPYCAVFVSWCADQAGLSTDIIPKTASVKTFRNFFKTSGRLNETAQIGDLMIQISNGASHIGIVVSVESDGFYRNAA